MVKTIYNLGRSVAVVIPQMIAQNLNMSSGTQVEITEHEGAIIVRPVKNGFKTLDELINDITIENRHDEMDYGRPVGREVW
ncbi:MAG: AbrB/MazE/SpoVT family DNA-binding domain-containing protein [Nitrospirota bacterium]